MRVRGSVVTAAVLTLLVAGWILSGQLESVPAEQAAGPAVAANGDEPRRHRVRTRTISAESYTSVVLLTGQTEASRRVSLRSLLEGRIERLPVKQGEPVAKGDVLAVLDPEDRPAKINEARARVSQRELEYSAAQQLADRGFQSKTKRAVAFANLQSAVALLERMETDLANATFKAPFDGILNTRDVELGDVVRKGDSIGELIDLDPVLVTAHVSERNYLKLRKGQPAKARFANGFVLDGVIRYISAEADRNTRTFKVELEIPNPGSLLIDGATSELVVPLPAISAHRISAALFSLDADGALGVKTVDADNTVRFVPVAIIGGTEKEIFVTGLPETAVIIVVGQDFVDGGDIVEPVAEPSS